MFKSIPHADAVLLKSVLHNWDDEHCIKVLKNCREAVGKEGKVIIIELVIDEKNDDHGLTEMKLYYDMLMMTLINGKERSKKEWEKLFLDSGFKGYRIITTFGFISLIEVYP
ncbi:hypothetical protein L6164_036743 [Bauhinia variegata]|uniref:Uncharacterized protein n=1 Tax=Bauhinia variegata TaxID=167791 RepID=A0ACB9KI14_BAUVA|nr:hypothetical protein L6164_036743 [Bauhinia variegata]